MGLLTYNWFLEKWYCLSYCDSYRFSVMYPITITTIFSSLPFEQIIPFEIITDYKKTKNWPLRSICLNIEKKISPNSCPQPQINYYEYVFHHISDVNKSKISSHSNWTMFRIATIREFNMQVLFISLFTPAAVESDGEYGGIA